MLRDKQITISTWEYKLKLVLGAAECSHSSRDHRTKAQQFLKDVNEVCEGNVNITTSSVTEGMMTSPCKYRKIMV